MLKRLVLVLGIAVLVVACNASAPADRVQPSAPNARADVGFRSGGQLNAHFQKHGTEFGRITPDEYLARARRLRDATVGGDVLEIVRKDGVVTRFDRASGAFIAFERSGVIRTFFRPNVGESYFHRQGQRPSVR